MPTRRTTEPTKEFQGDSLNLSSQDELSKALREISQRPSLLGEFQEVLEQRLILPRKSTPLAVVTPSYSQSYPAGFEPFCSRTDGRSNYEAYGSARSSPPDASSSDPASNMVEEIEDCESPNEDMEFLQDQEGTVSDILQDVKELERRQHLELLPIPSCVEVPTGEFRSVYQEAIRVAGDDHVRHKLRRADACDLALHLFLKTFAKRADVDHINIGLRQHSWVLRQIGQYPRYPVMHGTVRQRVPAGVTSLPPSLFTHSSVDRQGRRIPHLVTLLAFICAGRGPFSEAIDKAVERDGDLLMGDLIGRSLSCGETAARAIDFPGVYCIRPSGRLAMIGMSYGLGIKRRTAAYTSTSWNPNGKMGTAQGVRPDAFVRGKLRSNAIFWIDQIRFDDIGPMPAAAIYAVESVAILVTKSWASNVADISHEAAQEKCPDDPNVLREPVLGLNTEVADRDGAFLHDAGLNVIAARKLVQTLCRLEREEVPLPKYNPAVRTGSMKRIERHYRKLLKDIFPPSLPMKTIYAHVRLRSEVVRRALEDVDVHGRFKGHFLPGGATVKWRRGAAEDVEMW